MGQRAVGALSDAALGRWPGDINISILCFLGLACVVFLLITFKWVLSYFCMWLATHSNLVIESCISVAILAQELSFQTAFTAGEGKAYVSGLHCYVAPEVEAK
jgi:hypothetical protein